MFDLHGWEPSALWEDIKFDVHHFADIGRIAMVGEPKWQQRFSTTTKLPPRGGGCWMGIPAQAEHDSGVNPNRIPG